MSDPHISDSQQDGRTETVVSPNPLSPHALERLDATRLWSWFTMRTLITSGSGFFADAYDVFIINLVVPMLGFVYYKSDGGKIPPEVEGSLKGIASAGTLLGQLVFGYLGDSCGRQKIYGLELIVIILGTICCSMSGSAAKGVSALGFLGFWRFVLGFGIGGDYPMSATVTSEWSAAGRRGQMLSIIFSAQGLGNLMACLVCLILLACFKGAILTDVENLDYVWRLAIVAGAIPSLATIYLRFTMPESPRYAIDVENNIDKAIASVSRATSITSMDLQLDHPHVFPPPLSPVLSTASSVKRSQFSEFYNHFSQWKNLKILLGTSLSWFFLDIAFYGLSLNQSYVLEAIGFSGAGEDEFHFLWRITLGNLIISLLGFVPGYYFTVFFIERIGRKPIQLMGFGVLTVLFTVLAAAYHPLRRIMPLFVAIFILAQFFFNFGPNATTFVIPGEVFPTKVRATAHGISAASGKLGAIISAFGFNSLVELGGPNGKHSFLQGVLGIFAGIMFLGILSTFLLPETKGLSLEAINSGELQTQPVRRLSVNVESSPPANVESGNG